MLLPAITLLLFATPATVAEIPYWIEPCTRPETVCQPGDPELAAWALTAWQSASQGAVQFKRVASRSQARILILWASGEQGMYGETRSMAVNGRRVAEVYVRPAPLENGGDVLLRDAIVYLTCLHETGHALGLSHTAAFEDIMYNFQFGGDIPEYFGRYRRKLRTRSDIQKNSGMSEADCNHLAIALKTL